MTNNMDRKKGITTDPRDINRLIRKYHKLYTHKSNNLDEMNQFRKTPDNYNSPKMKVMIQTVL